MIIKTNLPEKYVNFVDNSRKQSKYFKIIAIVAVVFFLFFSDFIKSSIYTNYNNIRMRISVFILFLQSQIG